MLIPLVAALAGACSGVPSGVIPPERMSRLLADLEVADCVVEMEPMKFRSDSLKKVLLQSVYERNGVTDAEVDSSMMWYGRHLDKYLAVMDRTVELLEEEENRSRVAGGRLIAGETRRSVSADGDSVDVWTLPRLWRLSRTSPVTIVRFNLTRDRNWEPGDGYELKFRTSGSRGTVESLLAADYQRDRRVYNRARSAGDGWHSVKLQLDSASGASQLYGYISCHPAAGEMVVVDSVRLTRTHWKSGRVTVPPAQQTVSKK